MMECELASQAGGAWRGGNTWNAALLLLLRIPEVFSLGGEASGLGCAGSGSAWLGDTLLEVGFLPCLSALWYLWSEATRRDLGSEGLRCSQESPGSTGAIPESLGIKAGMQEPRARSASRFRAWESLLSPGRAKATLGIAMG